MISVLNFLKNTSRTYLLSYLITIMVIHCLLVWIEIGVITDRIDDFTLKFGADFYDSIQSENHVTLRKLLLKGKDEKISAMTLILPSGSSTSESQIRIGSVTKKSIVPLIKTFPLMFSGTNLGEIQIVVDCWSVSKILMARHFLIYLVLATFVLVQALIINFNHLALLERVRKALTVLVAKTRNEDDASWNNKNEIEFNFLNKNLPDYVSQTLQILNQDLLEAISLRDQYAQAEAQNFLAKQVAHDIRSPLSALTMIATTLNEVSEEKRLLIKNAVTRINDIANDLHKKSQRNPHNFTPEKLTNISQKNDANNELVLIQSLLEVIASEKRALQLFHNIEIDLDITSFGLFVKGQKKELARLISNLCNNAAEAYDGLTGKITLALREYENTIVLIVQDNGKGIPPEILAKLGEAGVSYGKEGSESGSGLGVYHAQKYIESIGGKFNILSQCGVGTMVQIQMTKAAAPPWFLSELKFSANTIVNILDDDPSIHDLWRERFQKLPMNITLKHFHNSIEFRSELHLNEKTKLLQQDSSNLITQWNLIDLELIGDQNNGLELISDLGLQENTVLVTSRSDEAEVQHQVTLLGIKLLPKLFAGKIPISTL